jgi:hypothetical protein
MTRIVAALMLVVGVTAACSAGTKAKVGSATTTTSAAPTTSTTVPLPTTAAELSLLLLANVPAGYTVAPDSVGDTGPSDLAKAIRDDGSPNARDLLTRTKFAFGYQRLWEKGNDQIIDFLYQFGGATGAATYLQASTAAQVASSGGAKPVPFAVPEIAGATGLSVTDSSGTSSDVLFSKGPFAVQVVLNASVVTGQQELVRSLAKQQYDKLPGGTSA